MSEEDIDEFLGIVLESYIQEAQFYNQKLLHILIQNGKYKTGMTKEEKMRSIKQLIDNTSNAN